MARSAWHSVPLPKEAIDIAGNYAKALLGPARFERNYAASATTLVHGLKRIAIDAQAERPKASEREPKDQDHLAQLMRKLANDPRVKYGSQFPKFEADAKRRDDSGRSKISAGVKALFQPMEDEAFHTFAMTRPDLTLTEATDAWNELKITGQSKHGGPESYPPMLSQTDYQAALKLVKRHKDVADPEGYRAMSELLEHAVAELKSQKR